MTTASGSSMQPRRSDGRFSGVPRPEPGFELGSTCEGAPVDLDERFIVARSVLIRGVSVLGPHSRALTLVGAQAVFELVSGTGLPLTLTTDGDQSVWPRFVDASHDIYSTLVRSGFVPHKDRPGIWSYPGSDDESIGFDLLVPGSIAGPGRRGARVAGQSKRALGRADGLELTLLDRQWRVVHTYNGSGESVEMYVAGPAAILCAKAYKLAERLLEADRGGRNRVRAKDAGDAWRMMATSDPADVRRVFEAGSSHETMGAAIGKGRRYLIDLFGPSGKGVGLAVADLRRQLGTQRVERELRSWMSHFDR